MIPPLFLYSFIPTTTCIRWNKTYYHTWQAFSISAPPAGSSAKMLRFGTAGGQKGGTNYRSGIEEESGGIEVEYSGIGING